MYYKKLLNFITESLIRSTLFVVLLGLLLLDAESMLEFINDMLSLNSGCCVLSAKSFSILELSRIGSKLCFSSQAIYKSSLINLVLLNAYAICYCCKFVFQLASKEQIDVLISKFYLKNEGFFDSLQVYSTEESFSFITVNRR